MTRDQVIRALRQLREEHERQVGDLLARLEGEAGKKGHVPDVELESEAKE